MSTPPWYYCHVIKQYPNFTFIDVETTGLSPQRDHIIEIGIVRVTNGVITHTFESLVNPDCMVPPEITAMTGISPDDLLGAPSFSSVIDEILALFDDSIFVAHNARFDYGFIKHECMRLERSFSAPVLCTARLSRKLAPDWPRHNLDVLIEAAGVTVKRRHRAFDDAAALPEFLAWAQKTWGEKVNELINAQLKTPSLPKGLDPHIMKALPESPGVYYFFGEKGIAGEPLLYVGKSVNLKERVKSHFSSDYRTAADTKITPLVRRIEWRMCAGDLSASILEAQEIKRLKPVYNRQLRTDGSYACVVSYESEYPRLSFVPLAEVTDLTTVVSTHRSLKDAKEHVIKKCSEYGLCTQVLGVTKGHAPCFSYQIGKCAGACIKKDPPLAFLMRFSQAFAGAKILPWPYDGAIVISESFGEFQSHHVFHLWKYFGTGDSMELIPTPTGDGVFDRDLYRIVKKYVLTYPDRVSVIPADNREEQQ